MGKIIRNRTAPSGKDKITGNMKLSTRLILVNSLLILIVSGVLTFGLYWQIRLTQRHAIQERLLDILSFSAPLVDGDFHNLIRSPEDETGSFYHVVSVRLKSILDTSVAIEHIYTLRQLDDGRLVYIVDVGEPNGAAIGQEYLRTSALLKNGLAAISGPVVEDDIHTDSSGTFLSGYVPIYDQFRYLNGVLGIDLNAESIIATEKLARNTAILSFLATVPFTVFLGAWFARRLTAPVTDLVAGSKRVANGQFDEPVPVHSRDELGVLAKTFNQMTAQLHQTLQGLEEEISKRSRSQKLQDIIYQISQAAVSTNNMDQLYKNIHKLLAELISVENFYIALYDPASDLISFPYYIDQYDEPPAPEKPGRGLTEYVLRSGQPLLATKEIDASLIEQGLVEMAGTPANEWLGAPLKVDNQIIGVMSTQSYSEAIHFTRENVDLFEYVSNQIAQTIERKRAEDDLNTSNERYYRLFEESPVALWDEDFSNVKIILDSYKQKGVTDFSKFLDEHPDVVIECADNVIIRDVNKAALSLLGGVRKQDLTRSVKVTFLEESYPFFKEELKFLANGETLFTMDSVKRTLEGRRIEVSLKFSVLSGSEQDLSRVIISIIDITERKKSESKLTYISTHDALTDLHNRAYFDQEMIRIKNENLYPVSVIMVDLDDLKKTNDRYGHPAGDRLLIQVAQALKAGFRTGDIVTRIGGDEFAILLPQSDQKAVDKAVQRFKDIITLMNSSDNEIPIRLSIGACTVDQNESLENALLQADQKMYLDKQNKTFNH
jgi:diguanylate cyclase (GGDEF)-like protein/PAS domain S-box-containing protein